MIVRIGTVIVALLIVAALSTGIAVVYARQMHRQMFIQLNGLEKERDDLNIEFGKLQLEQATYAENNRVEQIATGKLGMLIPTGKDIVVVRP